MTISIFPCFSEDSSTVNSAKPLQGGFFSGISYSIGTGLSYLNGQYREIVYTNVNSANPYLSELLWNLDNVFLLNIAVSASKGPWTLDLSLGTAVTKGIGRMEDYDWGDYSKTEWTNWSESLIFIDNSFFLEISSTYKHTLNKFFSVPIGFGYKLNYLDWEDKLGEHIYKWDLINNNPIPFPWDTGDGGGINSIDYKVIQNIIFASTGILFTNAHISTGLNLSISPFIYAWGLDHHILKRLYFLDSFIANFWCRAEFSLNVEIGSKGTISLKVFREEIPESVGDTYYYDEDSSDPEEVGVQTGYYPGGAGHASILWGIGLSYIWNF